MAIGATDIALGDLEQQLVPVRVTDQPRNGRRFPLWIAMIEVKTARIAFATVDAGVFDKVGEQRLAISTLKLSLASGEVDVRSRPVGSIPRGITVAAS